MLEWVAKLLGLPEGWHGHIEDTASTATLAAIIAAREATGRDEIVCSEHTHSAVDKAARMLGMRLRKVPTDGEFRLRVDALGIAGRRRDRGRDRRHDRLRRRRPGAGDRRRLRGGRARGARRRRLRGHGDGLSRVPLGVRRRRSRRLGRRQRAQVDADADGLLAAVDAPAAGPARGVQPRARVPAHARQRGCAVAERVRPGARPPLPGAEAMGGAALPRPQRPAGPRPQRRGAGGAVRGLGRAPSPAGRSARPGTSRSCASAVRATTTSTAGCWSASTPAARCSSPTRRWPGATCCGWRSAS